MSAVKYNFNAPVTKLEKMSGNKTLPIKVCVLQPDYSVTNIDYQHYDPPRNLAELIPEAIVDHVMLNKLTTYKQLKELKKKNYDVFVNLCEGYLEWEVPSIDVIYSLELLNLPFTGPSSLLYDPPKELMKYVAYVEGVHSPAYALIEEEENLEKQIQHLSFPLFVKPAKAGDSLGIDDKSLVQSFVELKEKTHSIIDEYGPLLIEEYIKGREFTVMVTASAGEINGVKILSNLVLIFSNEKLLVLSSLNFSDLLRKLL